jgi:hypothetical protein
LHFLAVGGQDGHVHLHSMEFDFNGNYCSCFLFSGKNGLSLVLRNEDCDGQHESEIRTENGLFISLGFLEVKFKIFKFHLKKKINLKSFKMHHGVIIVGLNNSLYGF